MITKHIKENLNIISVTSNDHLDLLKLEFSDEILKIRFLEMKETFYTVLKLIPRLTRLIKSKDVNVADQIKTFQKDFLNYRSFVEKSLQIRKYLNTTEDGNIVIKIEGLSEEEYKNFFTRLQSKKDKIKLYLEKINELEKINKKIQQEIETICLSNAYTNNLNIN